MSNNTQIQMTDITGASTSTRIHETRIDDVRTLWVEANPPLTAALMFRVGQADEALATRGITHLVEHLALSRMRNVTYPCNGTVEPDHTVFWASGSDADIVAFLLELSIGLADLPVDRLDVEARVLQSEAQQRGSSAASEILASRFGPHGPGTMAYPEFGLRRLTANDLQRWGARHFTAENAVLALTGPPPDGLRLPLMRGTPVPLQMPRYDNLPTEPTVVLTQDAGASVGVFGRPSPALRVGLDIVRERVEDVLRHERGHVYSVGADTMTLKRNEAFYVWGADCATEQAREVSEVLAHGLRAVAEQGPTRIELDRVVSKALHMNLVDRDTIAKVQLQHDARAALLGHVRYDMAEMEPMLRSLGTSDITAAMHEPFSRAMAVLAPGSDVDFATSRPKFDDWIDDRTYRPKKGKDLIGLSADGVARRVDGEWTALRFDELEVVDEVTSTRRILIDERGKWLAFDANEWRRGGRLLTCVDAAVPDAIRIPERR